jgi:DNA uptake protein ComE-like DNA-binding protein
MSLSEIDRLLVFREKNRFINSKKEFQQVTKVSDSLLNTIAPYFKFPDWVVKRNEKLQKENSSLLSAAKQESIQNIHKEKTSTIDINKASILDLQSINGIGDALSERIIKYRAKLQGFSFDDQLYEVWGLDKKVADDVLLRFKIIKKPVLQKLNVNTIGFKELLNNPYVDYNLCIKIFNYRDEVAELQDISELKNISGFPLDKYDRIVLYLMSE